MSYKERMKVEYQQTVERFNKLHRLNVKYAAGKLDFVLNCPLELLQEQEYHMNEYLRCLEIRAEIEGIDLSDGGGR